MLKSISANFVCDSLKEIATDRYWTIRILLYNQPRRRRRGRGQSSFQAAPSIGRSVRGRQQRQTPCRWCSFPSPLGYSPAISCLATNGTALARLPRLPSSGIAQGNQGRGWELLFLCLKLAIELCCERRPIRDQQRWPHDNGYTIVEPENSVTLSSWISACFNCFDIHTIIMYCLLQGLNIMRRNLKIGYCLEQYKLPPPAYLGPSPSITRVLACQVR